MVALAAGLGPAACIADPMVPCDAFEPGEANDNTVVRAQQGVVVAVAMRDPFVLRNVCDGPEGQCHVEKLALAELSPGSQVMLTTDGSALVGIDAEDGRVWTYDFDPVGRVISKETSYTDPQFGPAQLVIGMRDSNRLIVRDHHNRLGVYLPGGTTAARIAPQLDDSLRLAAVGERHVAVRVVHSERSQTLYVVDTEPNRADRPTVVATGDFTSAVFGPGDQTLVLSEGRGTDASVLVFDVESSTLVDAFAGDLVSSMPQNDHRAMDQLPGMHAVSPSGEHIAYRTTSGALAVRMLGAQSSCLVRNTNRLGTGREPARAAGDHAIAGFSADGILYAEYTVGASDSFVYAYDPRHQQMIPLGSEEEGWHLAAVPGRVTDERGEIERAWAVGVHQGRHASIAEGRVDGQSIGGELTFMPLADDGVWAIDTDDKIESSRLTQRALSVRRVEPPRWANGRLRFEQGPDEQVVTVSDEQDNESPMRVPLDGRVCLSTGAPGSWAYRCGDSTVGRLALTTNSGQQEQSNDPDNPPEFDPPFPEPSDEEPEDGP
ncbi:MAG: hypothetical protein KDK70_31790 [Myxococcales bacterium]|nr:hypothetical protein [Myxococcales bacterium]